MVGGQQIFAGHVIRFFHAEQEEKRGRDVGQNSITDFEFFRVIGDVDAMDKVGGVGGVG